MAEMLSLFVLLFCTNRRRGTRPAHFIKWSDEHFRCKSSMCARARPPASSPALTIACSSLINAKEGTRLKAILPAVLHTARREGNKKECEACPFDFQTFNIHVYIKANVRQGSLFFVIFFLKNNPKVPQVNKLAFGCV